MRSYLSRLPNADLPDVTLEADLRPIPAIAPDDDDLIRPNGEDQLYNVDERALSSGKPTTLAKYLIWTFGPDHQALPFHLQLRMEIEHDIVMSCDTEIGWRHQGIEKGLEGLAHSQIIKRLGAVHPRSPASLQLAFLLAIERSLSIDEVVPPRAQIWRVMIAELARIADHLYTLKECFSNDRRVEGFFIGVSARARLLVRLASQREGEFLPSVGGLSGEPGPNILESVRASLSELTEEVRAFSEKPAFKDSLERFEKLGAIGTKEAIDYGISGPALRATGFAHDIRKSDPYFAYRELIPKNALHPAGDMSARMRTRLDEIFASQALISRATTMLNDVGLAVSVDEEILLAAKPSAFECASIEAPSGELSIALAHDEEAAISRLRIRSPSVPLAQSIGSLLADARLDDVLHILHSLGLVAGEIDR